MALTQRQQSLFVKARQAGSGAQAVGLDDATCRALIGIAARDLDVGEDFDDIGGAVPELFDVALPSDLGCGEGPAPLDLFERFVEAVPRDGDLYFAALAALHRARLKYERILATQPLPTIDQVGPRSMLQYGQMPAAELAALLSWRKWMYDIDNRAAQETGYLFEPIIAGAIGGVSYSAGKSPVKRRSNPRKGRQIDCLRLDARGDPTDAYEFKLRVTIAASGQGRWAEELEFPVDCKASGLTPVLIVLDPTPSRKLTELTAAFLRAGGRAYIGEEAWAHLEAEAGPTMGTFLEKYVRRPLDDLLDGASDDLPDLSMSMTAERVVFQLGEAQWSAPRDVEDPTLADGGEALPEDADEAGPGT